MLSVKDELVERGVAGTEPEVAYHEIRQLDTVILQFHIPWQSKYGKEQVTGRETVGFDALVVQVRKRFGRATKEMRREVEWLRLRSER